MSILNKLSALFETNTRLVITPNEYQDLCVEVFNLGELAAQYDALILDYVYNGEQVYVEELVE